MGEGRGFLAGSWVGVQLFGDVSQEMGKVEALVGVYY